MNNTHILILVLSLCALIVLIICVYEMRINDLKQQIQDEHRRYAVPGYKEDPYDLS